MNGAIEMIWLPDGQGQLFAQQEQQPLSKSPWIMHHLQYLDCIGGHVSKISSVPSPVQFTSAFAIFEGGGARGLAHVGALRALEEEKHALVGVAGTSAGAIIAALVAVGYRHDEIFASGNQHVLKTLGYSDPVEILGRKQWRKFKRYKVRTVLTVGPLAIPFLFLLLYGLLVLCDRQFGGVVRNLVDLRIIFRCMMALTFGGLLISVIAGWWFASVVSNGGMFANDGLRDVINEALRRKLKQHYASINKKDPVPKIVEFRHIDPEVIQKCIPLKIVVTNVNSGELALFDNRDRNVPVADVVAASAALPGAFRPAKIRGDVRFADTVFTDGGLVSNLPSWVFRDEKKTRERNEAHYTGDAARIPIYAFSLKPELYGTEPSTTRRYEGARGTIRYLLDVVNTGIFGSQSIVADFVPDLRSVELRTNLKTIDFDCSAQAAEKAVRLGFEDARSYLWREKFLQKFTQITLDDIQADVQSQLVLRRGATTPPRLRVFLIDPICGRSEEDWRGFKIVAGSNCTNDADDRLELHLHDSISAKAFHKREAHFGEVKGRTAKDLFMTKAERALLPLDLDTVIAVPVFADIKAGAVPHRVLAIDSNDNLSQEFNDPTFMNMLAEQAGLTSRKLIEELYESQFPRENA